jgi:hypothetical protein
MSRKPQANQLVTIVVSTVSSLLLAVTAWKLFGPDSGRPAQPREPATESESNGPRTKVKLAAKQRPGDSPVEKFSGKLVACRFYTPEPGFYVLVDNEPARDDKGEKLTTPCEVGIPPGNHTLAVVREKFHDYSEEAQISKARDFEFTPVYEPFAEPSGYFTWPLATAKVGQAIELAGVNAGGPAWDPFLSADGLSLWFAGHKESGKGIFVSRRATMLQDFGKPELLMKNSDRSASPSVTEDGRTVAYVLHGRAQIRSLVHKDDSAPFKQGKVLCFSERDGDQWLSAQLSADGLKLYYLQKRNSKTITYVTTRRSLRKEFDDEPEVFTLPGGHPCLSADELRQYAFDGENLTRATRRSPETAFADPEPVSTVELRNYTANAGYRQFFISDDEQWLYYSDAPEETGKLYAVRIAEGPRRGYRPLGKPIPQKELAQAGGANDPDGDGPDSSAEPIKKPDDEPAVVDPRQAPLPYAVFRSRLEPLLVAYDFSAAERMVGEALRNPQLENDRTQLEWDKDDVERLAKFWKRFEAAVADLKPGDVLRAGSIQMEFGKYADGVFSGKVKGSEKSVSRTVAELTPVDLVTLVDKKAARTDEGAQLEIGTFLAMSPKASQQLVNSRLDRAGDKGKEVLERQLLRKLHLVEQEIARENIGLALQLIDQLVAAAPKSKTAREARTLRDGLPARISWAPIGPQTWDSSVAMEYAASGGKAPGAYLISPAEYGDFVLTLEWKTNRDTAQGGVYFHYKRGGELRKNAFKIHIASDHAIRANPDRFSTGSLFGIKGPRSNPVKPTGEWNTLVLRVEGDRVKATVNGGEVLDTPVSDPNIPPVGYICLDGEFGGITYRKAVVYELPAPATK